MAAVNLPPLTFTFGPYRLDHETGQLHHGDRIVSLQPRPLAVLLALLEAGGSLVTKEDLIERVWDGAFIEDSNITKCIAEIRQALRAGFRGADPVITVWKQGYRFVAPVQISGANPTPSIIDASAKAIRLVPPQPVPTESAPAPQPKFRVPRVAAILAATGFGGQTGAPRVTAAAEPGDPECGASERGAPGNSQWIGRAVDGLDCTN